MRPSNAEVVLAYRKLFKNGLHAIQYAKPQRYVLRDTMRRAFRNENPAEFNSERIENTVRFLENATRDNGIEHKVLKNLMHVRWWQTSLVRRRHRQSGSELIYGSPEEKILAKGYRNFDNTLAKLNESMNMCLR
ncbi:MAG: hypothetical protein MMC23_000532 [Stictis urceolatum]|nr:hypothetical protein [Stictis urceolata]